MKYYTIAALLTIRAVLLDLTVLLIMLYIVLLGVQLLKSFYSNVTLSSENSRAGTFLGTYGSCHYVDYYCTCASEITAVQVSIG